MNTATTSQAVIDTFTKCLPETRFRDRFLELVSKVEEDDCLIVEECTTIDGESGSCGSPACLEEGDTITALKYVILFDTCDTYAGVYTLKLQDMLDSTSFPHWTSPFAGDPAPHLQKMSDMLRQDHSLVAEWGIEERGDWCLELTVRQEDGKEGTNTDSGIDPRKVDRDIRDAIELCLPSSKYRQQLLELLYNTETEVYLELKEGEDEDDQRVCTVQEWVDNKVQVDLVSVSIQYAFGKQGRDKQEVDKMRSEGVWFPEYTSPFGGDMDGYCDSVVKLLKKRHPHLRCEWVFDSWGGHQIMSMQVGVMQQ